MKKKETKTAKKATKAPAKAPKERKVILLDNPTLADLDKMDVSAETKAELKRVLGPLIEARASGAVMGISAEIGQDTKKMVMIDSQVSTCETGCCVFVRSTRMDTKPLSVGNTVSALMKLIEDMVKELKAPQLMKEVCDSSKSAPVAPAPLGAH